MRTLKILALVAVAVVAAVGTTRQSHQEQERRTEAADKARYDELVTEREMLGRDRVTDEERGSSVVRELDRYNRIWRETREILDRHPQWKGEAVNRTGPSE